MVRRFLAVAALSPAVGCQWLGLPRDGFDRFTQRPVALPEVPPASPDAIRVHQMGMKLVAGSPFLGIDPAFQIVGGTSTGGETLELFHSDSTALFITTGLVALCKTDEQLAGVLAHELSLMIAESRRVERMRLPEPIPAAALGGKPDGSTDFDPGRAMYLADFEKNVRKPGAKKMMGTTDAKKIARDILTGAGLPESCLDDAQPILKRANRTQTMAKQLGGGTAAPRPSE